MVIVQSHLKKKDGERTEWKYLKCSQYRRAGKHDCVNHVPIQYGDFRQFIINLLVEKGEFVTLRLQNTVEKGQEKKIKKLQQLMSTNQQKKKTLLDLYLEELINKEEFEKKRHDLEAEITKANHELLVLQNSDAVQINIKTIKQAFEQLQHQEQDLLHVFQILIQKISIHQDGTVDIVYTFGKGN